MQTFRLKTAARFAALGFVLGTTALLGQSSPKDPEPAVALEMPVVMQQNIVAGKTPVGTAFQAKLTVATLVKGTVIPRDAVLFGEVTESATKSATEPSRLAIRVDSAQWKNGSKLTSFALPSKLYLTAWYYVVELPESQDASQEFPTSRRHASAQYPGDAATYPNPNTQDSPPCSRGNTGIAKDATPPGIVPHRVVMKNVESVRGSDGNISITSKRSDIKLDKSTTYVLATSNLLPSK